MSYFPMFISLEDKCIIIAGGGKAALGKVRVLSQFPCHIKICAPQILDEIKSFQNVEIIESAFDFDLLNKADLCIGATDCKELNHKISRKCRAMKIPVNCVDDPEASTFIFGAMFTEKDLCVAVSTSGASPSAASYLRNLYQETTPDHIEEILEYLHSMRSVISKELPSKTRQAIFRALFAACMQKQDVLNQKEQQEVTEKIMGDRQNV